MPEPEFPPGAGAGSGGGRVYAYEVDGFGNALFMDDANAPSLLSLPLLGYVNASDPDQGDLWSAEILQNQILHPSMRMLRIYI